MGGIFISYRREDSTTALALTKSVGHAHDAPLATTNTNSVGRHGSHCAYTDTACVRSRVHIARSAEVI